MAIFLGEKTCSKSGYFSRSWFFSFSGVSFPEEKKGPATGAGSLVCGRGDKKDVDIAPGLRAYFRDNSLLAPIPRTTK
jgi:hypothetical protein